MSRVYVIAEGQSEEAFVSGPLAAHLWSHQIYVTPIVLGVPGHKGGNVSYSRLENDVLRQLKQDIGSYCTTMVDYYGLGKGFPGTPVPTHFDNIQKVEHVERAVKEDICRKIPEFRPDVRLIPYLSLHEYEALLFSDPDVFAQSIGQPRLARSFHGVLDNFPTPEDINCGVGTHPSKRVIDIYAGYKKVIEGTQAARAVGIQRMREKCAHFGAWLEQLEALPEL